MSNLRVAIVGSGPTGFYAAQHLFNAAKNDGPEVEVDMFDRLPTPFGLVRFGVAPDHAKIKSVTALYHRTAQHPGFRFYGNVDVGGAIPVDALRAHYHQILFCTGAQTDRRLGIPGEDLRGSHTATEFVAWYNGHPDYRDHRFDLTKECAVVVGVGNVAVDVARILCRTPEELAATDIADHALAALTESKVKRVVLLGRRGPAQAAFTNAEAKELGELSAACAHIPPAEAQLDEVSRAALGDSPDKMTKRKLDIIAGLAGREEPHKPKRLEIRFLVSPTEIHDDGNGAVGGVRLVRNTLVEQNGRIKSVATDAHEELPCGLVFRSVGYRGVPVPGVPFRDDWGTMPHEAGRVLDQPGGNHVAGLYCAGWIKRGPQGVIGTNKPDALETVRAMLEDHAAGKSLTPETTDAASTEAFIRERCPDAVSYADWERLDALEIANGEAAGRPRVKFTDVDAMLAALKD